MSPLDVDYQSMAANAIAFAASMAGEAWQQAAYEHTRPSIMFKPALSIDNGHWCALYGDNLQDGVAGFGDSPHQAMLDFDSNWHKKLVKKEQINALSN